MLRITQDNTDSALVLRLEGRLQGPWVDELRDCFRRAREASPRKAIRIELMDVRFVDGPGKTLLTTIHNAGVEILAEGCLMKAIREEIVADAKREGTVTP